MPHIPLFAKNLSLLLLSTLIYQKLHQTSSIAHLYSPIAASAAILVPFVIFSHSGTSSKEQAFGE
jgi:hypothetical protein